MNKRQISTITLPSARADQLRRIAEARGLSVTDLIAGFIKREIRKGTIPDEVPGIGIVRTSGSVELRLENIAVTLESKVAKSFARDVERMASQPLYVGVRRKDGKVSDIYPGDLWVTGRSDSSVLIRRRGRGVVLRLRSGRRTAEKSLNPTDALDLSRLMR